MKPIDLLLSRLDKVRGKHPANDLPSVVYLNECFRYEPKTGKLFWKLRPREHFHDSQRWHSWNSNYSGREAGTHHGDGYRSVSIDSVRYKVHRVCFVIGNNRPLDNFALIDHSNGCTADNRIENLREATASTNAVNFKGARKDNGSGARGIGWKPQIKKWEAWIQYNGKRVSLGVFRDKLDAAREASAARKVLYGDFYTSQNV